jgi:hypothetical protein
VSPAASRIAGAYLLTVGALGLVGLAVGAVSDFAGLRLLDLAASTLGVGLSTLAGYRLWRQGWTAAPLGLLSQLPQLVQLATGSAQYRLVVGCYWLATLGGAAPHSGPGFSISFDLSTGEGDFGRWTSLNLVALALSLMFGLAWRRTHSAAGWESGNSR